MMTEAKIISIVRWWTRKEKQKKKAGNDSKTFRRSGKEGRSDHKM